MKYLALLLTLTMYFIILRATAGPLPVRLNLIQGVLFLSSVLGWCVVVCYCTALGIDKKGGRDGRA